MNAEKKILGERARNLNMRREAVVAAAWAEFSKNGIESTSIQQIADRAGIGVASVYRYYANKGALAVQAAILNWRQFFAPLTATAMEESTGRSQLQALMTGYLNIFTSHPEGFLFFEDFDNYISHLEKRPESMIEYEEEFARDNEFMKGIITLGIEEGSFRTDIDLFFYNAMAGQAVSALAQKLLKRGHIIRQDEAFSPLDQLKLLIETLIQNILIEDE